MMGRSTPSNEQGKEGAGLSVSRVRGGALAIFSPLIANILPPI